MSAPGSATSPPPHPGSDRDILRRVERGEPVFGEKLAFLGSGPLPIPGAKQAAVVLDAEGDVVLIVFFERLEAGSAAATADELDRIAELEETELLGLGRGDVSLAELHAGTHATVAPPSFNRDQRVVLVTDDLPSLPRWRELVIELGRRLSGVFVEKDGELTPAPPPAQITTRAPAGTWKPSTWLALFAMLVGVAIVLFAISRALFPTESKQDVAGVTSPIRQVVAGVPSDASNTHWINQQRVLRDGRGRLLVLYRTDTGIQLVIDQANQGRSWRAPIEIVTGAPQTFSAAIDRRDNIHIAITDGDSVQYLFVRESAQGWEARSPLVLDEATDTADVDLTWNDASGSAQIVWIASNDAGQTIMWADVVPGSEPSIRQTETLTEPAGEISALAAVASGPDGDVLATYRKASETFGWFSRAASITTDEGATEHFEWASEEQLPTDSTAGALSVAIDGSGVAHLVLRDSSTYKLDYFRRNARGGWTSPEQIVDAESIEEIDFPTLAVDDASKLVYVFFQSNQPGPFTQVQMAVRDPASGWEGPFALSTHESHPDGASYPTAPRLIEGQPIVLWTRGGTAPALEVARASAP